ncbi:MAG: pseudouridine synthase [Zetaproteobacteria bacterium CG06_land_8_20_14_3_00_59_53]|nr:MAG: pseudouridine synthase [Zetaproteobacteria bacterium CG2_30_59_37]PIO90079.1 MAG: pseudouridine synthase [Zetaproteobacteria bacterium CG23_combo_of_CG06-09_8_20_14_all_59_86]PIQ64800.1 MAG: pseudouridine synthase [Zetaproteobacteria bacterium CG11_big_fil_rev_8_21_14_0_20_59_439]PIU69480.1 MAG: pseudouridine synthase [Zetaproteobacteria bacterium CG06_land_8_20_14_3_00_59_53]PIU96768.1 MAG: pseudouridine synthase [Zetaproteobacteria bacterium CG03_land_8_20_14_0_80_59_51]PIY46809.1 MA
MTKANAFHDLKLTIPVSDAGKRVDDALAALLPFSKRRIRTAIDDGGVYIDKRRSRKAGRLLKGGERIRLVMLDGETLIPFCEQQVIWRDGDLLLIHKRAGQYAQEALHRLKGTLPAEIAAWLGLTGEKAQLLRPVHRLDRDTSGLMLLCSSPKQLNHLQANWATCVEKTYLAVVEPAPEWDEKRITLAIAAQRNINGCYRPDPQGRACDTSARVLERQGNRALLELTPHTGRSHQLRVHMAAEGCPILGDSRYGGKAQPRLMLHAYRLCVQPPALNEIRHWEISPEINAKEDWQW